MTSEASPFINYIEFPIFLMTAKNFYSNALQMIVDQPLELKIKTLRAHGLFMIYHVSFIVSQNNLAWRKSKEQVDSV